MFNRKYVKAIDEIKEEIARYNIRIITWEQGMKKDAESNVLKEWYAEQIKLLEAGKEALEKVLMKIETKK